MKDIVNGIIGMIAAINISVLLFLEKIADKITSSVETAVSKFILIVSILLFAVIIQTLWPGINMMVIIILLLGLYLIGVIVKHSRFAATVFLVIWCLAASYLYVPGVNTMALSFGKKLSNYGWSKTRHEVDREAIIQDGYDNANRNAADVTREKINAGDFDGALKINDSLENLKNKIDSSINDRKKPNQQNGEVKTISNNIENQEVFDNTGASIQKLGPNKVRAIISPTCCLNTELLRTPGCTMKYTQVTNSFRVKGNAQPYWLVKGNMEFERSFDAPPDELLVFGDRVHYAEVIIEIIPATKKSKK